ncbi:MAG: peptidase family M1 [Candidatus Hydrogenedentes bacterium]|nr:peptidase family M1 [Candidatus Hydrogenedentota bacterium]
MTASTSGSRDVLTQDEATARAARVSHASYDVQLDLHADSERYQGAVTIRFQLTGDGPIELDSRTRTIERVELNGDRLDLKEQDFRIVLPADALTTHNTVTIVFENEYDHGGDGFHRFTDPEDGEVYLYTNLEPYATHRLFPCFDQPDIKAEFTLAVAAPDQWELIANGRERSVERLDDGRIRHSFETTAPFSTYLFALIAGPYQAFRDQHGDIPLGFFCRKSLVKYVDIDEIWEVTKQGLDFFASFFDYAYPFVKYDQIAVPEFNAGAMENVGAVTFNEYIIHRDPPTESQRAGRANVILHEMAHMWFGNLVTMKWWNDLWLNESFADYMSYLAMYEATRFKTSWQSFNRRKAWAYREDQLVTTHLVRIQDIPGLLEKRGLTSMDRTYISNMRRLVGLPDWAKGMINDGTLTASHGKHILQASGHENVINEIRTEIESNIAEYEQIPTVSELANIVQGSFSNLYRDITGTWLQDAPKFDINLRRLQNVQII